MATKTKKSSNDKGMAEIRAKVLMVRISTKMPGTAIIDSEASALAAKSHGAAAHAVRVVKSRFNAKNPLFKAIAKTRGLIRNAHLAHTRVWEDDGWRLVTAKQYSVYKSTVDELFARAGAEVARFIDAYDDVVAEAKADLNEEAGGLWEDGLIPSKEELREKFQFDLETSVLPDNTNIFVQMDAAQIATIQQEATTLAEARILKGADETQAKVAKALTQISEAMKRHGAKGKDASRASSFKDSTIDGVAELVAALPGLNITSDPKVDRLTRSLAEKFAALNGDELRESGEAREAVASEADALSATLGDVFGTQPTKD